MRSNILSYVPSYTGTRCRKPSIRITVSPEEHYASVPPKQARIVRTDGDVIEGWVDVSVPADLTVKLKMSFCGVMRVWVGSTHYGLEAGEKPFDTMEHFFLKETVTIDPDQGAIDICGESAWAIHRYPFCFTVPRTLISPHDDVHPSYMCLPPSARLGRSVSGRTPGKTFMQPLITYRMQAYLVTVSTNPTRISEYCADREIEIRPYREALPPLDISDYPGDFRPVASTCSTTKKRGRGELHLSTMEPVALSVNTKAPRATTAAVIRLCFSPGIVEKELGLPYEWSCEIATTIRKITFCSTRKTNRMHTVEEASKLLYGDVRVEDLDTETRVLSSLVWRQDHLASNGTIRSDDVNLPWTTTLSVPVSASKRLLPTFTAELASRRYSLLLRVRIKALRHKPLEVEVPLQVVREPRVAGENLPSSVRVGQASESEAELPDYQQDA